MCASIEPHIRRTTALLFDVDLDLDRDVLVFAGIVGPPETVVVKECPSLLRVNRIA
jgi:hypothetical protein